MTKSDEPLRPLWVDLDLSALGHNLDIVRRLAGTRRLIASVKANAYGHGAVPIARELARLGVDTLWTGSLDEALVIRDAGIDARILLFGGYLPGDIPALLRRGLVPTIYDHAGARAVSGAAVEPTPIYIKVDAGLGRLGIPIADAEGPITEMAALSRIVIEGVYTHLPFGDAAGRDRACENYRAFAALLERLAARGVHPSVTQVWASSGVLAGVPDACNAVCVGHLLYGLSPVVAAVASAADLRPVMTAIRTWLIHVAHRSAGGIPGGSAYGMRNAQITGVVPLGLTDGMRNAAPGQVASLLVRGRRAPVLGVSLEHTTLDLTGIDSPQVGDEVTLLGRSEGLANTFQDLARWFGCGELEALMSFSGRLRSDLRQ